MVTMGYFASRQVRGGFHQPALGPGSRIERTMSAPAVELETEWVVVGADGKVVLILAGADAEAAAAEWERRRYQVVAVRRSD